MMVRSVWKLERLPVRVRRTLNGRGEVHDARSVFCPYRRQSMPVETCESCERFTGMTSGRGCPSVSCWLQEHEWMEGPPPKRVLPSSAERTPISRVMTGDVLCVTPDVDARKLGAMMLERNISAAPVVDEEGGPIGVVSKTDLVRAWIEDAPGEPLARPDREAARVERPEAFHLADEGPTVGELMMRIAYTLREEDSLARAAALMAVERVHHLPVVGSDGRVVGVLSSLDLVRFVATEAGYDA